MCMQERGDFKHLQIILFCNTCSPQEYLLCAEGFRFVMPKIGAEKGEVIERAMMISKSKLKAGTVGSSTFNPNQFLDLWRPNKAPQNNDLKSAIVEAFGLRQTDDYIYHASASVSLTQVQVAIDHGSANGMHAWYRDEGGDQLPPPNTADIEAYTQIFSPLTVSVKAISAFAGNAKKNSVRAAIARNLHDSLHLPSPESGLVLPGKQKTNPVANPALDFWHWSCHCLEWAGPDADTVNTKQSHHILPILYHHWGCICPSYDALSLIQQLSKPSKKAKSDAQLDRPVLDIGSGNGYWTCLLRRMGLTSYPVDNALSAWRTMWVADTINADAVSFLKSRTLPSAIRAGSPQVGPGGAGAILLLVYPQVSNDFTATVINAYKGNIIVVAGTQNKNGFTGFVGETVAEWMAREKQDFQLDVQIPLPSFAGKDEALFIFQKRVA